MIYHLYFKIQNTTKSYDIPDDSQGETSQTEGETLLYETGLPFCMRRTKRKRRIRIAPFAYAYILEFLCIFTQYDLEFLCIGGRGGKPELCVVWFGHNSFLLKLMWFYSEL